MMEIANSLAFSEAAIGMAHQEALAIYEQLAIDKRYKLDPPVFFRYGCALARTSREDATIRKAIRHLQKARLLIEEADRAAGINDPLVSEGAWLYYEIPKQLGYCNFVLSELPGVSALRRKKFLDEAIVKTREAVERPRASRDPHDLIAFTQLKARGNLIYLLAQRIREAGWDKQVASEIGALIGQLKARGVWDVAVNQVAIVDSVAFGAATIGDWATALEEAERNLDSFASLSLPNGLPAEDLAMQARAREIQYFARFSIRSDDVIKPLT
jgi:hypothetical protein